MVKAHSLLYAIYISILIAIICGALIFFFNIYNQLNLYYNMQEEIILHNHSLVNFALGNNLMSSDFNDQSDNIHGEYETKLFGALNMLISHSITSNDTISSVHCVGNYNIDNTAIFLTNFSKPLSFFGTVKLSGNNFLPLPSIENVYLSKVENKLIQEKKNEISETKLPELNKIYREIFEQKFFNRSSHLSIVADTINCNSFLNPTKEILVTKELSGKIIKGNFIIKAKDTLIIKVDNILEDLIIMAPTIIFEKGFSGAVQAFATKEIKLEEKVSLKYPSLICVYNDKKENAQIEIQKNCRLFGGVILFGNKPEDIDKNKILIEENGYFISDIYCEGKLSLRSDLYGSIFTNRFFYQSASLNYENTIANIEINPFKRPEYFIPFQFVEAQKKKYGILKRVY